MVTPNPNQPSLFPEPTPKPLDTEAIASNARKVDYEDRTSEAARDQGWGPQVRPTAEHDAEITTDNRPLETPDHKITPSKDWPTEYDREIGRAGLAGFNREEAAKRAHEVDQQLRERGREIRQARRRTRN